MRYGEWLVCTDMPAIHIFTNRLKNPITFEKILFQPVSLITKSFT